jgi:hypothetical protein
MFPQHFTSAGVNETVYELISKPNHRNDSRNRDLNLGGPSPSDGIAAKEGFCVASFTSSHLRGVNSKRSDQTIQKGQ